ncbi:MAG TPA: hypothetical protein VND98_04365 [Solirubrobacterales bacterium]|nr:hypothetical protein [Solirubrobacterales bacterium]
MYTWAGARATGGTSYTQATSASYPIPLGFTPKVGQIAEKGAPTTECPGSSEKPKAAPGYLCVYETRRDNGTLEIEVDEASQSLFGFALYAVVGEGENFEYGGRWAVTAP